MKYLRANRMQVLKAVSLLAVALGVTAGITGCGKKGPPLAPYVRIPAGVEKIAARRVGGDVYISLTVPSTNIDASLPVAISRVDIYGYTGTSAPRAQWAELGTLIARVPIAALAPAATESAVAVEAQPMSSDAALPGSVITVRDTLTPEKLQPGPIATVALPRTPAAPAAPGPLRRFYVAIGFSPRGIPGPTGATTGIALQALPDPPTDVRAFYSATDVTLSWEPSGGILGYVMDRELPPEEGLQDDVEDRPGPILDRAGALLPAPPTSYHVYRVLEPDPLAPLPIASSSTWNVPPPAPLNPVPTTALSQIVATHFDRRGCYTVHAVRGSGVGAIESEPSDLVCVTPIDIFPPASPLSLAAVPASDAISLIWEANDEADVAGYLVLRGEAADATLQTLTPAPIVEPRYRDATAKPGVQYVYAVVAVDSRLPLPNVSAESNRVEETAR